MRRLAFALALAAIAGGCASARPALPMPPWVVDGILAERPAEGDPRRYDLEAWGEDYLLEFLAHGPFESDRVLRIYPDRTVCAVLDRRGRSLFRFRPGAAVPDEDATVEPTGARRLALEKARFESLGAERECLERGVEPPRVVVAGSASRAETASPEQARALSESRARAVAALVREARPDLGADQIEVMALGWDGFARPDRPDTGVAVFGGAVTAQVLPIIFTGPALSSSAQAHLGATMAIPAKLLWSSPCVMTPAELGPRRRLYEALDPLFAALKSGCRISEPGFWQFLERFPRAAQEGPAPSATPPPEPGPPPAPATDPDPASD